MTSRTVLTATLLSLAVAGWTMEATPAPAQQPPVIKPTIVAGEQSIAIDAVDLKQVAKARFFVSQDQGKTWTLAQEITVDPANPQMPKFAFKPQSDGAYYIVTAIVHRDGTTEPEPKANSIPAKALLLVVDASAPVVSMLEAVAEPVTDPAATSAVVDVNWVITDANFASATLEISTDGGATFVSAQAIAATGSTKLTAARNGKDGALLIRILAKDAAGNQAPSLAKTVILPQPPDPEKALVVAVSSLPTLAEVQPLPDAPAKPADAAAPAAGTAAAGTAAAGTSTAATPATGAPAAAPAAPVATAPTTTKRTLTPPANTTFLAAAAAAPILDEARSLRDAGDVDGALSRYLRLHDSAVAPTAVDEELAMLSTAGDQAAVAGIAGDLPPELRGDAVRLAQGKALLALGRPADAETTLLRVRAGSDEAREATLTLGKAYLALGKTAASTRIFEKLAKGDDAVAQEAKLLRGK